MSLKLLQLNIRGNHCSIVARSRAGSSCRILDSETEDDIMTKEQEKKIQKLTEAVNQLCATMKDEKPAERRRPNLANEMLADARRVERHMSAAHPPGELDRLIRGRPQSSEELRQSAQAAADDFAAAARRAGIESQRRWGYETRDCRPSLRRSTDATPAEDFEDAARARRKELLGR
jgi:hypothetical protein